MTITVAALMTSFNRREVTLRSLARLREQSLPAGTRLEIFLVDDASTDGTPAAVRATHPDVHLLLGDGSLYWTGGMSLADAAAWATNPEFLLWLNDDVELDDALSSLLDVANETHNDAIVVGALEDPDTGTITYGGHRKSDSRHPLHLDQLQPSGEIQEVDTMNGNVVLLPAKVRQQVGPLDLSFSHNMADMDYAFRARRAGYRVVLAPSAVGKCAANPSKATWEDPSIPLMERWRVIRSIKGLPPREWLQFTRRHAGWWWPRYFLGPYIRCLLPRASNWNRRGPHRTARQVAR